MNFPVEINPHYLEKAARLKIEPADIVEQFVRGSGAGGQKINKTSSAVLVKHLPTGIEVKCQSHREQSRNRVSAYKLLIDKIEDKVLGNKSERAMKVFKVRKQKKHRSKRAKEKMVESKRARAALKVNRSGRIDF